MKIKIFTITIMLLMVCSALSTSANVNHKDSMEIKPNNIDNVIDIRVARLSTSLDSWNVFDQILYGYQWMVDNRTYNINLSIITDKDIIRGKLTTENFDLLVMPYLEAEMELIFRSHPSIRNFIWKSKVTNFIKSGGGFVGYCAPTLLTSDIYGKPKTLLGKLVDNFDLKISGVEILYENGLPFLSQLTGKPELIGPSAYLFYCGYYIPLDVTVNKNNPIFNDLIGDKRRIGWCAGPALMVPDNTDNDITVLANFPEEEISDNVSTQIHAWKYMGGIRGLIKGFIKARILGVPPRDLPAACYFAGDWERTDKIIQTNLANKPFMTMETYPNENEGRIILSGGHPESCVFFGGHVEERKDTKNNILAEGFFSYIDYKPWDETPEEEFTYNWWIVRRHVAWASKKVSDNDLPPVYSLSEVNDFKHYNQSSNFKIEGNMETSKPYYIASYVCSSPKNISLDLFCRYSNDNSTNWENWELYKTDSEGSDGWSWEFNASDLYGPGFYQFYSIKHVEYQCEEEHIEITEPIPPGPDAIARIVNE